MDCFKLTIGILLASVAFGQNAGTYSGGTSSGGGGGGVSAVGTGTCLTGGTITSTGTISLAASVVAKTSTYQVLASDFSTCNTINVTSGTFTITLVASGTQPANGAGINVINSGSGVVTIARSGQNINGGTASLVLNAGTAIAPTSAFIQSNGTDYVATVVNTNTSTTGTAANLSELTADSTFTQGNGAGGVQSSGKVVPSGAVVGNTDTQTLTNKTVDGATPTEIGYVAGVTSPIQTQLNTKGTVASVVIAGTGNQITVTGTCTITTTGTCTLSIPSAFQIPGTINKLTLTQPATGATLTILDGKTVTLDKTLEFTGTDGVVITFPTTSATVARTDAGQTFTGTQVLTATLGSTSTATTQSQADNSTKVATTAYVDTGLATKAGLPGSTICNGSASATVATCPGVPAPTTYGLGTTASPYLSGTFIPGATSSGAPLTLNIAGLGAKNVFVGGIATSASNTVTSGVVYGFQYDGTQIQVLSGGGGGSGNFTICSGSNSATAATCTPSPAITTYTSLTGYFVAGATSTAAPLTLNISGLGTRNVYLNGTATNASPNQVISGTGYSIAGADGTNVYLVGGSTASPFIQTVTSVSSIAITHNLNTSQPWVVCYDGSGNIFGGTTASAANAITNMVATSANVVTVTFFGTATGVCKVSTGGVGPTGATGAQGPAVHSFNLVATATGQVFAGQLGNWSCTIVGWSAFGDVSGSASVDVDAKAGSAWPVAPSVPNTTTDKISASAPIAMSSQQSASGGASAISTWTTSRVAYDSIAFNVTTLTTIARLTITVYCQ